MVFCKILEWVGVAPDSNWSTAITYPFAKMCAKYLPHLSINTRIDTGILSPLHDMISKSEMRSPYLSNAFLPKVTAEGGKMDLMFSDLGAA